MDLPAWAATLIAALVAGLFLFHVHRVNSRRAAATRIRGSFTPALGRLEAALRHRTTHDVPDVDGLLRQQFESHAGAVKEYRHYISARRRKAYDETWEAYCYLVAGANAQPVFIASTLGDDPYAVLIEHIDAILRFAPDT